MREGRGGSTSKLFGVGEGTHQNYLGEVGEGSTQKLFGVGEGGHAKIVWRRDGGEHAKKKQTKNK